jgi:hypothetical protein
MEQIDFTVFKEQIEKASKESANKSGRGAVNIEDQIRVANELIKGMEIYISTGVYGSGKLKKKLIKFQDELQSGLNEFVNTVLTCERDITQASTEQAAEYLMSFLVSFASRSATRERLNIFGSFGFYVEFK